MKPIVDDVIAVCYCGLDTLVFTCWIRLDANRFVLVYNASPRGRPIGTVELASLFVKPTGNDLAIRVSG